MGSVLGFLSVEESPDATRVERMARAAPHRGDRSLSKAMGPAVLGVTWRSEFPDAWIHTDLDLAVAFCGTLDNASELREAWAEPGREELPGTPAAVVAAGIRRHGVEEAARRLRGVFGVVWTDGSGIGAFRDHIGFYPLVYRADARGLFVATEVKQVVAGSGLRREPDLQVLEKILYRELEDDPRCAIAGVRHLPPAIVLRHGNGHSRLDRYWRPETLLESSRSDPEEIHARFQFLMEQAVGRCLMGKDVVSLSGGVDSPAVAAFAAPLHLERRGEPLPALSALFPAHPSVDETPYIEAVARELGLPLHRFQFSARPTDDLERWIRLFDGPVPTVAFSQILEFLEAAGALGFRNILSGEQEEFLFEMRRDVISYLVARGRLAAAYRYLRARRERGDRAGVLIKSLGMGLAPGWIRRRLGPGPRRSLPTWLDQERPNRYPYRSASQRWRDAQLTAFEGTGLHLPADNAIQEVAGVHERRPFADVDLVEYTLSLPAEIKHGDIRHKGFLRSLLQGRVPEVILNRWDKTVFDAFIESNIDYPVLRRWLLNPAGPPMPGVRYELLAERLEREALTLPEYMHAKDLACIHAFLSEWENG